MNRWEKALSDFCNRVEVQVGFIALTVGVLVYVAVQYALGAI